MKLEIEVVGNGYIVTKLDEESKEVTVFESKHDSDVESVRDLLGHIESEIGHSSSRHDDKRIYVIIAPGDKHEKFTEAHSEVIWGDE